MTEQPAVVDTLYLDAEHFALTAEARPLEQREHVRPVGRPFAGLLPDASPARPSEEPTP